MNPSEIKKATLKELRKVRRIMFSYEWELYLKKQDKPTRKKAAKQMLKVHQAIMELENQQLAAIRDKLINNEAELTKGCTKLGKALQSLNRTKNVINATAQLLSVVARIVPLLALL